MRRVNFFWVKLRMSESTKRERDMKHGLSVHNRISLVVFWLRASLLGLLLLPVSDCNNWPGGYCNRITFPSNTDLLCTTVRSSGSILQIEPGENVRSDNNRAKLQLNETLN